MPSAKYSCSGSPLMFWKGKTAMDGFSNVDSDSHVPMMPAVGRVHTNRSSDVLDLSLAPALKLNVQLPFDLIVDRTRCKDRRVRPTAPIEPPHSRPRRRCRRPARR